LGKGGDLYSLGGVGRKDPLIFGKRKGRGKEGKKINFLGGQSTSSSSGRGEKEGGRMGERSITLLNYREKLRSLGRG